MESLIHDMLFKKKKNKGQCFLILENSTVQKSGKYMLYEHQV